MRQTKRAPALTNTAPETVADPSAGPEQRVIDADTARTLRKLVDELSPRRQTLLRALFTDNPRPYSRSPAPPESPRRHRAHPGADPEYLRYKLTEYQLGPEA